MSQRINAFAMGNKAVNALNHMGTQVHHSSLDRSFLELLYFRVSQINGCAFCLDMHSKELRANGETEQRIFLISAWRECSFYTDREKAGLLWAETLTSLNGKEVSDEIYAEAIKHFSETELVELTMAVIAINSYNRINIAFGADVGTYEVAEKSTI
ncbi:carboxymuconolactone decarboxylase family protein [Chryseobacterium kwangjuense]|uniref:Carboxymuconolactone decarboxylase family protein n=1 Tax=Chryseobacterium kwangjuense TaxID=267125 RepID=A0ABW9JZY1_9FLAO